jgi:type IV pilus assembly protein PilE
MMLNQISDLSINQKIGNRFNMKNNSTGFTLIEMMITVAILGILAALAYPQYVEYVAKGKRAECRSALLIASQKMEKFYSNNNRYPVVGPAGLLEANINPNSNDIPSAGGAYVGQSCTIEIFTSTLPQAGGTAATFVLTATRKPNGSDRYCNTLTFDQLGTKDGTGPDRDRCWR